MYDNPSNKKGIRQLAIMPMRKEITTIIVIHNSIVVGSFFKRPSLLNNAKTESIENRNIVGIPPTIAHVFLL